MHIEELSGIEKDIVLDALRHSIKYANSFLEGPTSEWVAEIWRKVEADSFAIYKKLGGIYSLEELR